jgi:hypothetical protein
MITPMIESWLNVLDLDVVAWLYNPDLNSDY